MEGNKRGFTLIELLVAVAILAISSVVLLEIRNNSVVELQSAKHAKLMYLKLLNKLCDLTPLTDVSTLPMTEVENDGNIEVVWNLQESEEVLDLYESKEPKFYSSRRLTLSMKYKLIDREYDFELPVFLPTRAEGEVINDKQTK